MFKTTINLEESNNRLFQAQDEAIKTLHELCRPIPPSLAPPSPRSGGEGGREGDRMRGSAPSGIDQTHDSGLSTQHSPDIRNRRLTLQEASIRLRAAAILLRTLPHQIIDDDDDVPPGADAHENRKSPGNAPRSSTSSSLRPTSPAPQICNPQSEIQNEPASAPMSDSEFLALAKDIGLTEARRHYARRAAAAAQNAQSQTDSG